MVSETVRTGPAVSPVAEAYKKSDVWQKAFDATPPFTRRRSLAAVLRSVFIPLAVAAASAVAAAGLVLQAAWLLCGAAPVVAVAFFLAVREIADACTQGFSVQVTPMFRALRAPDGWVVQMLPWAHRVYEREPDPSRALRADMLAAALAVLEGGGQRVEFTTWLFRGGVVPGTRAAGVPVKGLRRALVGVAAFLASSRTAENAFGLKRPDLRPLCADWYRFVFTAGDVADLRVALEILVAKGGGC
ncbi:MAG: hypothetical protein ACUVRF_10935 [Desulfotomaculales bacterium]